MFAEGEYGGSALACACGLRHRRGRGRLLRDEGAVEVLGGQGREVAWEEDHSGARGEESCEIQKGIGVWLCHGVDVQDVCRKGLLELRGAAADLIERCEQGGMLWRRGCGSGSDYETDGTWEVI